MCYSLLLRVNLRSILCVNRCSTMVQKLSRWGQVSVMGSKAALSTKLLRHILHIPSRLPRWIDHCSLMNIATGEPGPEATSPLAPSIIDSTAATELVRSLSRSHAHFLSSHLWPSLWDLKMYNYTNVVKILLSSLTKEIHTLEQRMMMNSSLYELYIDTTLSPLVVCDEQLFCTF